jgi:ribulose-phosphate 3-epimerase
LRRLIDAGGHAVDLEVDGGIDRTTAPKAIAAGADALVAGTATFEGGRDRYAANIAALRAG